MDSEYVQLPEGAALQIAQSHLAPMNPAYNYTADVGRIKVQRLWEGAKIPEVKQAGDAAADLFAGEDVTVPAKGRALVRLGIAVEIPYGFRIKFHSRSGLSYKHGIETGAGLIDNQFRDGMGVVLYNHSDVDFEVKIGDRISQMCLERYSHPVFEEVMIVAPSSRTAGFGSSGRR